VQDIYAAMKRHATELAGEPGDIPRRAILHHAIYLDAGGNHTFPLMAMHGALWGYRFFETTGRLGQMIRHRYFYSRTEREERMAMLNGFAEGFKVLNRAVFIDTVTNYRFSREHGLEPGAEAVIRPELLSALNGLHAARREGRDLTEPERRHLFTQCLRWEQEVTVGPGVQREVAKFDCPVLRMLVLKPVVRFAYFPRLRFLAFRNFAETSERLGNGIRAYELAESEGWAHVAATIRNYAVLPVEFFSEPLEWADRLGWREPVAAH